MDTKDVLRILRRQWLLFLITVAVVFVLGFGTSFLLTKSEYAATCRVSFNTGHPHEVILTLLKSKPASEYLPVKTRVALARSPEVAKAALEWLVREPSPEVPISRRNPPSAYRHLTPDKVIESTTVSFNESMEAGNIECISPSQDAAIDLANAMAWGLREQLRVIVLHQLRRTGDIFKGRLTADLERLARLETELDQMNKDWGPPYNRIRLPEAIQAVRADQASLRRALEELERERSRIGTDLAALRSDPKALLDRIPKSDRIRRYEDRVASIDLDLENKSLRWTPLHPQLRSRQEEMASLLVRIQEQKELDAVTAGQKLTRDAPGLFAEIEKKTDEIRQNSSRLEDLEIRHGRKRAEYQSVVRDTESLKKEVGAIDQTLQEMKLQESLLADLIVIEEFASRAGIRHTAPGTVSLFAIIAALVGFTVAFLRETLDVRVATTNDVERYLNYPLLGTIPRIVRESPILLRAAQRAPLWDLFQKCGVTTLATSDAEHRVILVTSPNPATGKTTVAANLAIAMAGEHRSVLLVDADMRRPAIHRVFEVENRSGLSAILEGMVEARAILDQIQASAPPPEEGPPPVPAPLQIGDLRMMGEAEAPPPEPPLAPLPSSSLEQVTHDAPVDHLKLILSGLVPINPTKLLDSPRCGRFLRTVREMYNVVIIDSPPILIASDALVMAPQCDLTLLVVGADSTTRSDARAAKQQLGRVKCEKVGVILNNTTWESTDYYYYYQNPRTR